MFAFPDNLLHAQDVRLCPHSADGPNLANPACFTEFDSYLSYIFWSELVFGAGWVYGVLHVTSRLDPQRRLHTLFAIYMWSITFLVGSMRLAVLPSVSSLAFTYFSWFTHLLAPVLASCALLSFMGFRPIRRVVYPLLAIGNSVFHFLLECSLWRVHSHGHDRNVRLYREQWPYVRAALTRQARTVSFPPGTDSVVVSRLLVTIAEDGEIKDFLAARPTPGRARDLLTSEPHEDLPTVFELVVKAHRGCDRLFFYYADFGRVGMPLTEPQQDALQWFLGKVNDVRDVAVPGLGAARFRLRKFRTKSFLFADPAERQHAETPPPIRRFSSPPTKKPTGAPACSPPVSPRRKRSRSKSRLFTDANRFL